MKNAAIWLILAAVFLAPTLSALEAKVTTLLCLFFGLIFAVLEIYYE